MSNSDTTPGWIRPAARVRPATALGDRLVLECARNARHGVEFCVLAVHHFLWSDDGPAARLHLSRHVTSHVAGVLRVSDAVFHAGLPGCHVVVLPHTPEKNVGVVIERIEAEAREHAAGEFGPVRVDSIPVGEGSCDAAAIVARVDAHFREQAFQQLDDADSTRPPARLPVGDLARLEEALHTEINLAGRDGTSLSVIALYAPDADETVPGLLACDVDEIAARTIRGCDQVFEIGPSCTVLVLARTRPEDAAMVAERVINELTDAQPDAAYGTLQKSVLSFDRAHPDASALLEALRRLED